MDKRSSSPIDAWAEKYCDGHVVPTVRRTALKNLLRECLDNAQSIADTASPRHCKTEVMQFMSRFSELRQRTLREGSWQLEVILWVSTQPDVVDYVCKHRHRS